MAGADPDIGVEMCAAFREEAVQYSQLLQVPVHSINSAIQPSW